MSLDGIEVRPVGTARGRLTAYSGLLGEVFGDAPKFSEAALDWRYARNPAGHAVGADAWAGDILAAHYVTCPLNARIDGRMVRGLLSLNTATHPTYQGRGLFTRLAEAAYGQGAAAGYQFVIGVANANSTPGFLRKLGFQLVAPLQAGLLLRPPHALAGGEPQFAGHWPTEALGWRLANPAGRYALSRRRGLLSVRAVTDTPFVDCAAYVPDPGGLAEGARPRLAASLFIGLEPRLDLTAHGFVAVPRRLRPSPLNLIYRPLDPALPRALSPAGVSLNFLDFDPY